MPRISRFGIDFVDEAARKCDHGHRLLFRRWIESDANDTELGLEDILAMAPRRSTVIDKHGGHPSSVRGHCIRGRHVKESLSETALHRSAALVCLSIQLLERISAVSTWVRCSQCR